MATPDYERMTLDDLQAENIRLASELDSVYGQRRTVLALINRREAEAAALARTTGMNDLQKDALRFALRK